MSPDASPASPSLSHRLRAKRSELMQFEIEAVALDLFYERGFASVTVDDIASAARTSARTFYRYFPAKEDIFQVQIDRRCASLQAALATRPGDEAPLHSLRVAVAEAVATEDLSLTRLWTEVIAATPGVVMAVIGGIQLKTQQAIAAFFAARLELPIDALVPTMLAAAATGIIQSAQTKWMLHGGDLATMLAEGIEVLEDTVGLNP